jgi:hypothetical protein
MELHDVVGVEKHTFKPTRRQGFITFFMSFFVLLSGVAFEALLISFPQMVELSPTVEKVWLYGFSPFMGLAFVYYFFVFLVLGIREIKHAGVKPLRPEQPEVPVVFDSSKILDLQYKQLRHDQIYHQDIFVLSTHHKMQHFTLHLNKYGPAMLGADMASDYGTVRKKLVDAVIILMSCANAFNMSLEQISQEGMPAQASVGLGEMTRSATGFSASATHELVCQFIVHAGQMCKAVEALDHIERFNSRESLESSVKALWFITLQALGVSSSTGVVDVETALRERLLPLEQRHMFHWRFGTYANDYQPQRFRE